MNSVLFYKLMSGFYDLLDVIYFRKYETSPRKVVNESIKPGDKMEKIMAYGVMSMPAIVINEKVVSMGKVLKSAEVIKLIGKLGF